MQKEVLHLLEQPLMENAVSVGTCRFQLIRICPDLCTWCLSSIACSRFHSDSSVDCINVATEGKAFCLVSCAERAALGANACWKAQLSAACLGPRDLSITRYLSRGLPKACSPRWLRWSSACSDANASIYASCPDQYTNQYCRLSELHPQLDQVDC